jgi:hypothetical protein
LEASLRPNAALLIGGSGAIIIVSVLMLPWPAAIASAVLGALMIAGADGHVANPHFLSAA